MDKGRLSKGRLSKGRLSKGRLDIVDREITEQNPMQEKLEKLANIKTLAMGQEAMGQEASGLEGTDPEETEKDLNREGKASPEKRFELDRDMKWRKEGDEEGERSIGMKWNARMSGSYGANGATPDRLFHQVGERYRTIEALRKKAEELSVGCRLIGMTSGLPPDVEEEFWRQIVAYETAEPVDLIEILIKGGVNMAPADLISEAHISDRLWEAIYFLSSLGCYLINTDHLSDRELYTVLREEILCEPVILFPDDPSYACHLDIIGAGSEEDVNLFLKYYAHDEDRRRWREDWPGEPIPEHEERPYDRDRHLPRPYRRCTNHLM